MRDGLTRVAGCLMDNEIERLVTKKINNVSGLDGFWAIGMSNPNLV